MTCHEATHDLDAYVDRELGPAADASVRDHLAGCMACRGRAAEREALARLIRRAPYYAAPADLRARIVERASAPSRRTMRGWAIAAAAVIAIGLGSIARFSTRDDAGVTIVDEVVDGHVRSLQASHVLDVASSDQHAIKPWFLGKLDFAPPVVDLEPAGFPLVGGRLDYVGGRVVAAIVYRTRQHTINLFVWPSGDASDAGLRRWSRRGFQVQHWDRDGLTYWAISDVNERELAAFVAALRSS